MFIQSYFLEKDRGLAQQVQAGIEAPAWMRFEAGFDMSMTRENPTIAAIDWARFNYNDEEDVLDKETWEENYARPDTNWYEGITEYQAEAIRDEYDYNLQYQAISNMNSFNAANMGGYFAGALLDPLNYLPWTRFMAGTLKFATRGTNALASVGRSSNDVLDAVIGSVVGEGAIYNRKNLHQTEYDMNNAIINVAMAGTIGAGLAGMRKVARRLGENSIEENVAMAGKSLDDGARGKQIEVDSSAPPQRKTQAELEREAPVDGLANNAKKEWDLLTSEPTIKAAADTVSNTVKKASKAMVDFINCRIG
jgi:hypothetical protein